MRQRSDSNRPGSALARGIGLAGNGTETGRLERKRERIAGGGVIGIGLNEPDKDSGGLHVEGPVDISDGSKLGLLVGINARVYPPLPLDIHGYENADRSASILVLRVTRSSVAPHKYTGAVSSRRLCYAQLLTSRIWRANSVREPCAGLAISSTFRRAHAKLPPLL
jgi:hypothetical protein